MKKRKFSEIMLEVAELWEKTYNCPFRRTRSGGVVYECHLLWQNLGTLPVSLECAIPYLEALSELNTTDPRAEYWAETAKDIVPYFLANVMQWRGEDARRIKAELKAMIS